ncbi:UbiA prenyltransferase family [Lentinula raphanica]|nr:UbiA prenyltransferase family [Lentinula raphanica]
MPSTLDNYYRLARLHAPVGTFLVFWPFAYALLMSAYKINMPLEDLIIRLAVYGFGSFTLRSAACVWNDICDVGFDRQVERTRARPLASGAVSMTGAYIYLILFILAFVASLYMLESEAAFYQGVFDVVVLNLVYPLMKRVTYFPQAWLGLAINWGFVIVWFDVSGQGLSWNDLEVPAYGMVSLASWTIIYDTIYACQDLKDDRRVGVKSTALLFGSYLSMILRLVAVVYISALAYIGYLNGQGAWFYGVSVIGSAIHMIWQLGTHDPINSTNCKERFDSNINLGGIVAGGLFVDYLFRVVI